MAEQTCPADWIAYLELYAIYLQVYCANVRLCDTVLTTLTQRHSLKMRHIACKTEEELENEFDGVVPESGVWTVLCLS